VHPGEHTRYGTIIQVLFWSKTDLFYSLSASSVLVCLVGRAVGESNASQNERDDEPTASGRARGVGRTGKGPRKAWADPERRDHAQGQTVVRQRTKPRDRA